MLMASLAVNQMPLTGLGQDFAHIFNALKANKNMRHTRANKSDSDVAYAARSENGRFSPFRAQDQWE